MVRSPLPAGAKASGLQATDYRRGRRTDEEEERGVLSGGAPRWLCFACASGGPKNPNAQRANAQEMPCSTFRGRTFDWLKPPCSCPKADSPAATDRPSDGATPSEGSATRHVVVVHDDVIGLHVARSAEDRCAPRLLSDAHTHCGRHSPVHVYCTATNPVSHQSLRLRSRSALAKQKLNFSETFGTKQITNQDGSGRMPTAGQVLICGRALHSFLRSAQPCAAVSPNPLNSSSKGTVS